MKDIKNFIVLHQTDSSPSITDAATYFCCVAQNAMVLFNLSPITKKPVMDNECRLREGVKLDVAQVAEIAMNFKSLAVYSMLAYDHEDDPEELMEVVENGLTAIEKLFDC